MNRETLDGIVKQALFAYSNSLLVKIGEFIVEGAWEMSIAELVREREHALELFRNDAKRAAIVDALLKEMNS